MEKICKNISDELPAKKEKYRDKVDMLLSRISLLSGEDKLLMIMYWEKGNSLSQISRLAGVSRLNIARRIHKITERLMEGRYITCLRNRDRFTKREMVVAKEYFLLGLSMKAIAGKSGWSYYRIRQILKRIQLVLELVSRDPQTQKTAFGNPNEELSIENEGMVNADI
jgi:DNA-directed RNA polymerase specialized sigma subunit